MKHCLLFVGAMSFAAIGADIVTPMEQTQWKYHNTVSESVPEGLRVRVPTTGNQYWGSLGKYIKGETENHFLQIRLGNMEDAVVAPFCSNASSNGGRIGLLYSGYNTFKMPKHAAGRSFYLSLGVAGIRTEKVGPWVDFREVRTTTAPAFAPVVTLEKGDAAVVGSTLNISCRIPGVVSGQPEVRFFLAPRFVGYRFNDQDAIPLKNDGRGVYTASLKIDDRAFAFDSAKEKKFSIMAMVTVNGENCYYTLPFPVKVETKNEVSTALADAGSLQVRDDRKLWLERSRGLDLARGKKLQLVPAPDYGLTTDEKDVTDLTRGRLTSRSDDRVWFDRDAVGWYFGVTRVFLRLDLGKVEPVEKVVVRLLGGTTGNFKFPSKLELHVSKDGKTYHSAASMQKLMPCESAQSDWKRYYFLEESAPMPSTRMYPFELSAKADARYLILEITGETGAVFSDALACIKAEKKDVSFNQAYRTAGAEIPMEGLIIRPRLSELAVMTGLPAPQKFTITDMRVKEDRKKTAELVLELPKGITWIGQKGTALPSGATRYVYDLTKTKGAYLFPGQTIASPTLYLDAQAPVSGEAVVYARSGGVDQFKTKLPVRAVTPPAIVPFKRLHVSLSWMGENNGREWPDFLKHWRRLGFNTVSSFPRFWTVPKAVEDGQKYVSAAQNAGYRVIMNDSSFHEMVRGKKAGHEVYCQIPGRSHTMLCPSYRGEHYRKEMERVRRCTRDGRPAYVFYDIEIWHDAHKSAPSCTRCKEAIGKSGKSLDDFLYASGAEMMADLKKAIALGAQDANIPMPVIGSYNRQALHPKYGIEEWSSTYPASLDMAQPSLYVAGRAQDVHDNIRGNHKLLGNKKIVPWLSTGCYGEFDSFKVEQMVLEALMNGAQGVTYYCFDDFTDSPLDFYYHLKALAAIRPHEDLVMDGKVTEIAGSNKDMTYSMLQKGNEALLLAGNYRNADPKTTVNLPFKPTQITDLRANKTVSGTKSFMFDVPRGDIRLFHIR